MSDADQPPIKLDIDRQLLRINRCRHGVFLSLRSDQTIGKSLEVYGEWAEGEIGLLQQILRPGDIAIDAGANIGTHSLAFARSVGPSGRVYAFEPQPLMHQILAANALLNGLRQVSTVNAALSDREGWVAFPELDYARDGNYGALSLDRIESAARNAQEPRRQKVPLVRLDDVLLLDRLRLIKADVEGMEPALLRGARGTIERLKPALYLECGDASCADPIFRELEGLGYHSFWHVTRAFNPKNWRGETRMDAGRITEVNLLCVPANIKVDGMTPATGAGDYPLPERKAGRHAG